MIIDAAVHPLMPDDEYRARLPMPWRGMAGIVPTAFGGLFEPPFAEVDLGTASDPSRTAEILATKHGTDAAVLTPLTRGLLPNPLHAAAVARVTNEWICDRWLDRAPEGVKFFASIRVPVTDPRAAVAEIEAWVSDPRFVQIAVPLRVHAQYGNDRYFPIWEAASDSGLPVYVQDDLATATEPLRSPVGQPIHFAEHDATRPLLSHVHLASIVMSGLQERFPSLRFIFGDGGLDFSPGLHWRLDADWMSNRVEVPWVEELPSQLAPRIARFVSSAARFEHDPEPEADAERARITSARTQLVYGSHHPYWDGISPDDATGRLPQEARAAVLAENLLAVTPRLELHRALFEPAAQS